MVKIGLLSSFDEKNMHLISSSDVFALDTEHFLANNSHCTLPPIVSTR
jgi:hypothetical protein